MSKQQVITICGFAVFAAIFAYFAAPWFAAILLLVGLLIVLVNKIQVTHSWKKRLFFMTLLHAWLIGQTVFMMGVHWEIIACYVAMYLIQLYSIFYQPPTTTR